MSFWDSIRNFFGLGNSRERVIKGISGYQHNDIFAADPRWMYDEDENNIRSSFWDNSHFNVFSDPLEMTRYFESQIDHMLKGFMFGFGYEGHDAFTNTFRFESPHQESLRNKMLKPNCGILSPTAPKKDSDLDGKITPDNFSTIWDKHEPNLIQEPGKTPFITGKRFTMEYLRGPDGTIKKKQIIRDHEGNEEITISQQTGDKLHTVIIKKDKNGVETKTENFVNAENNDLTDGKLLLKNEPTFNNIDLNFFSWEKFFNPNPKL